MAERLTKDEREFLKQRFREWKRRNGATYNVAGNPKLVAALYDLMYVHGYCQSDVAMFLGLTRERVRQWCEQAGIDNPATGEYRVWNGERFETIGTHRDDLRRVRSQKRRKARDREREAKAIAALRAVRDKIGRVPTLVEFADQQGWPEGQTSARLAHIVHHWKRDGLSYAECADRLWMQALGSLRPDGRRRK